MGVGSRSPRERVDNPVGGVYHRDRKDEFAAMLDNGMRVYSKHDCVLQGYEGWPYIYAVISYFAYYDDAKLLPKLKLVYAERGTADAPRNWMILTNEVHGRVF